MKANTFFPSLGLLVVLNILIKPIWIFAIDRQVQNEVGTAAYGIYFSLFGLSVFFNFLLDWGLTIYFNRQLASDPENFTGRAGSFMVVKLFFALLYSAIVILIAIASGIDRWDILIPVIVIQVLTSFFVFLRSIATAKQWFNLDAWMSVIDKFMMILICAGFLYYPLFFGTISLKLFLYIQILCTSLAILILMGILLNRKISFTIRKPYPGISVFRSTLPYALIVLLMSAHYRLDGFLLERLHPNGEYQAGLYAGAYRLLDAANMIGFLFASFLLPYISNLISKRKNIESIIFNSRHLLITFSIFISVTAVFMAPWLQAVLYSMDDISAVRIMQWCLPVLVFYSLIHVYGTLMTAQGYLLPFSFILLLSVTINIILNLVLIPGFGAIGCCISALVSQGIAAIASLIYASRKTRVNLGIRSLLIYIFIAGLLSILYYVCRNMRISPLILISSAGLFTAALAYQFKLINSQLWKLNNQNPGEI